LATQRLKVLPRFHQRWWFRVLVVLLGMLVVSTGWALWVRHIQRQNTALQDEIRARKALASELHQALRVQALGQLASGVAHDFNNILSVISGASSALTTQLSGREAQLSSLIEQSAARGAELVARLSRFGRRRDVASELLDIAALLVGFRGMLDRVLRSDLKITLVTTPASPVHVDRVELEQAILNLVINARDATPGAGTITIRVDPGELPEAERRARGVAEQDWTVVEVEDTGCGMDEELQRRVFEPFFTTKGEGRGTGLGLASVHRMVQSSGGFVTVDSIPGRGTTFRLWFPAVGDRFSPPAL